MDGLARVVLAFAAATLVVATPPALAQQYPTRGVKVITPFPAGNGPDAFMRVVLEKLSRARGPAGDH